MTKYKRKKGQTLKVTATSDCPVFRRIGAQLKKENCTAFTPSAQTADKRLFTGCSGYQQILKQRQLTGFVNQAEFQQFNEHERTAAVFI